MQNKFGVRLTCALTLLLSGVLLAESNSSSRDLISQPVDPSVRTSIRGTAHPWARPEFDRGRLNPGRVISRASLALRLSSQQQAELDRLLREQQDPSSVNYHKWLTPELYAERFGVSTNDLGKITAWLSSQGLQVDAVSQNRREIFFSGTVGQIERAFQTEIHRLSVKGEQHFANVSDIQVPAAFANMVIGVRKFHDFDPRPHLRKVSPHFTSNVSGNHFLTPADFATIYDLGPLYSQGLDGTGQSIAVMGQTDINVSDAHAFRAASGLSTNDPIKFLVPNTGTATTCSMDVTEADLDVEWSGAVAKNASVVYVFAGPGANGTCSNRTSNVFDALQYVINNKINNQTIPVISISYGDCESRIGSSASQMFQQWAQQANSQGQTITAAAGDDGAADCDFNDTSATQGLAVDVPASIPEVTGIGGSEFSGDPAAVVTNGCASATTYWSGSCSLTSGASALSYIPEIAWNDPPGSSFSATGGGASTFFAKPTWQTGPGVPSDSRRDVPDVSLNGSPAHDPYLVCTPGTSGPPPCTNGYRDSNDALAAVGGTSVGAPTFAGILAIINQATQSAGIGNANSHLYSLAVSTPSAFHDITSGDNKVPCTAGSTGCPSGGTIGFAATANYDQATGLGTIDAFNLVTAWPGFVTSPAFSVSANPLAFTVPVGGSGAATVTVGGSEGFTGTVSLSCAVPANTSNISCAVSPSSVALNSTTTNGSVTLTINGTALARGPGGEQMLAAGFLLPGLCLAGLPMLKGAKKKWAGTLLVCLLALLVACGGGSSSSSKQNQHQVQTYAVTVTATSGATSHALTLNVTE
ncbi:MAG: S8/S53 family peptidase [Acidobacteria bacterium]|nr:S8/S53 family peptidase [Acidobacteriota bacterium]